MTHQLRLGAGVTVLALGPIFLVATATGAAAGTSTPTTKAAIEHAESQAGSGRSASAAPTSKAQVESDERSSASTTSSSTAGATGTPQVTGGSTARGSGSSGTGDSGAAAWQLALSAVLGAGLTGGAVMASRQLNRHQQPLPG